MSVGDYLAGLAIFALMLGGVVAGAALIVRRRLGHLEGVPRLVAFAILATAGLLAVHIVPGMLGVLARGSVLAATAAWLGAAILASPARAAVEGRAAPTPRAPRALEATAAIGALAVLVFTVASAFNQLAVAPASVDLLNFHLPTVARWIQGGSIWHVSELLPNVAPGAYPNNGDVVLLAAALPWHDDFLAHLAPYPFYTLTGVAVYGLARELGAAVAWALLAAALVLAVPA